MSKECCHAEVTAGSESAWMNMSKLSGESDRSKPVMCHHASLTAIRHWSVRV